MIEMLALAFAAVVGLALGAVFFGGLWWTVERGLTSPIPAVWFLGSLLVRSAIALTGFWLVSEGHWQRTLACLAGFLIARMVVARLTRATLQTARIPGNEATNAA